jgi:hypothetical protein
MKKLIFTAVLAVVFALPFSTYAQVSEPATQAQVEELRSTLIALLTQMIAELQKQIVELTAKQAETQSAVVELGSKVETQTAVATTPEPVAPTASVDFSCDAGKLKTTIVVSGTYKRGLIRMSGPSFDGTSNLGGGWYWGKGDEISPNTVITTNLPGNYDYKIWLTTTEEDSLIVQSRTPLLTGITNGSVCQ